MSSPIPREDPRVDYSAAATTTTATAAAATTTTTPALPHAELVSDLYPLAEVVREGRKKKKKNGSHSSRHNRRPFPRVPLPRWGLRRGVSKVLDLVRRVTSGTIPVSVSSDGSSVASPPLPLPPSSSSSSSGGGRPSSNPSSSSENTVSATAVRSWVAPAHPASSTSAAEDSEAPEEQEDSSPGRHQLIPASQQEEEEEEEDEEEVEREAAQLQGLPRQIALRRRDPPRSSPWRLPASEIERDDAGRTRPGAVRVRGPRSGGDGAAHAPPPPSPLDDAIGEAVRKEQKKSKTAAAAVVSGGGTSTTEGDDSRIVDFLLQITSPPAQGLRGNKSSRCEATTTSPTSLEGWDARCTPTTAPPDLLRSFYDPASASHMYLPPWWRMPPLPVPMNPMRQQPAPVFAVETEASKKPATVGAACDGGGGGGDDDDDDDDDSDDSDDDDDEESSGADIPHLRDPIAPREYPGDSSVPAKQPAAARGDANGPGFPRGSTGLRGAVSEAAAAAAEAKAAASKAEEVTAEAKAKASKAEAAVLKLSHLIGLSSDSADDDGSLSPLAPIFSIEEVCCVESDSSCASSVSLPLSTASDDSCVPGLVAIEEDYMSVGTVITLFSSDEEDGKDGGEFDPFQDEDASGSSPNSFTKGFGVLGLMPSENECNCQSFKLKTVATSLAGSGISGSISPSDELDGDPSGVQPSSSSKGTKDSRCREYLVPTAGQQWQDIKAFDAHFSSGNQGWEEEGGFDVPGEETMCSSPYTSSERPGVHSLALTDNCNGRTFKLKTGVISSKVHPEVEAMPLQAPDLLPKVSLSSSGEKDPEEDDQTFKLTTDTTSSEVHLAASPEIIVAILCLKPAHQFVPMKNLLSYLGPSFKYKEVVAALEFLSVCGVIYFFDIGTNDLVLLSSIILDPGWKDSMLHKFKDALLHHASSVYQHCSSLSPTDVRRTLLSKQSHCPLMTDSEFSVLCQHLDFFKEYVDSLAQLPAKEKPSSAEVLQLFKWLLIDSGDFLPVNVASNQPSNQSEDLFFIPSALEDVQDMQNLWTFKSKVWETTLCHTWKIDSNIPSDLMGRLTVAILEDLCVFSKASPTRCVDTRNQASFISSPRPFHQSHSQNHCSESIKILQLLCWKTCLFIKVMTTVDYAELQEPKQFIVEMLVALLDQDSPHYVGKDEIESVGEKCLLVSGRGPVGNNGQRLWQGGYEAVVQSTKTFLASYVNANFDSRVACNMCLAHLDPHEVSTWSCNKAEEASESPCAYVVCQRGHRINWNTICGKLDSKDEARWMASDSSAVKPIPSILPSVVQVCIFDRESNKPTYAGSGFVVDSEDGLIATAAHVLLNSSGSPKFNSLDSDVHIGIISSEKPHSDFRYTAEIIAANPKEADACILQIKNHVRERQGPLLDSIKGEDLNALEMTTRVQPDEPICLVGFNQGGEGLYAPGARLNQSVDISRGYICMHHMPPQVPGSGGCFAPKAEIVSMCSTIAGQSGGPVVSDAGKVVGLLSSADHVDDHGRCYLVPSQEIQGLIREAKEKVRLEHLSGS